jgi:hypothetical protein
MCKPISGQDIRTQEHPKHPQAQEVVLTVSVVTMQTQDGVLRLWVYAKSKWHKKAQSK